MTSVSTSQNRPDPLRPDAYRDTVRRALEEDLGAGDVTSAATVPAGTHARGVFVVRQRCVLAGLDVVREVFRQVDARIVFESSVGDGDTCEAGAEIARISGPAAAILSAERTALNFLQYLSGIATRTRAFVDAAGGRVAILDTRKTTPTLRVLAKYAVRCGGGVNHRAGLFDAVLIKDNHIRLSGGVAEAVRRARSHAEGLPVEVEAQEIAEVDAALEAGADVIMLDNLPVEVMRQALARIRGRAKVEISGGITLDRVPELARLGADRISVGALTHSAPAVDIALEMGSEQFSTDFRDLGSELFSTRGHRAESPVENSSDPESVENCSDPLISLSDVDSTNDVALDLAGRGAPDGTAVLADMQRAGRGRRGRTWFSPPGAGLYLSVVARPCDWGGGFALITLAAGVAAARAITRTTGLPVELKWPNDIVVGRPWRKLGGVLCEAMGASSPPDAVVIGIGINLEPAAFPPDIADRATCIQVELGRPIDRMPIVAALRHELGAAISRLRAADLDALRAEWRRLAAAGLRQAPVRWQDQQGWRAGAAHDIDDDGALVVYVDGRRERIISGEVIWDRVTG